MEDLKTLVNRLLEIRPNNAGDGIFEGDIIYIDGNREYSISLCNFNKEYNLNLTIKDSIYWKQFDCILSEKEFMEIKWKIEAWNDKLAQDAFGAFKSFIETHPQNSMDELLND